MAGVEEGHGDTQKEVKGGRGVRMGAVEKRVRRRERREVGVSLIRGRQLEVVVVSRSRERCGSAPCV